MRKNERASLSPRRLYAIAVISASFWILYSATVLFQQTVSQTAHSLQYDDDNDNDDVGAKSADAGRVVLRRHPGFTSDSIGYNAETGQSVHLRYLNI